MAARKKNKARKQHAVLNLNMVKSAGIIFKSKNAMFFILSLTIFFGLIIAAHIKVNHSLQSAGLKLVVTYKGDGRVGNQLSLKGKQFLVKNSLARIRDDNVLKEVYAFYSGLPEVERVHYVRRVFPDRLEVKAVLREPFVRVDDVYFDRRGCRLSREFDSVAGERHIPRVVGLRYPRSLNPGDVWENIYFREVLRSVEAVGEKITVAKVLVPGNCNEAGLNGIVLQTAEGALVCWGKVFNEGTGAGMGVESKVRNLDEALRVIASNLDKVKYVDISHEKPVIAY